jgi:hypothetical protein
VYKLLHIDIFILTNFLFLSPYSRPVLAYVSSKFRRVDMVSIAVCMSYLVMCCRWLAGSHTM